MGSFVWSADSTKVAYVAEVKLTNKEKSFFTSKISSENNKPTEEELMNEENYEKVQLEKCSKILINNFEIFFHFS